MPRAEDYQTRETEIKGVPIVVESYRVGEVYHCHVANKDPGATIARADGPTREAAEQAALAKARERL